MPDTDRINFEFNILNERIKAQVEIYEKFSQAFEKTLEILRNHGVKLDDMNEDLGDDIRDIISNLSQLMHEVKTNADFTREKLNILQESLNKSDENIISELRDLQESKHVLSAISSATVEIRMALQRLDDILGSMARGDKSNSDNVANLITNVSALITTSKQILEQQATVADQVSVIFNARSNVASKIKAAGIWFIALVFFLGLAEKLIQLGLLHLSWGGTH